MLNLIDVDDPTYVPPPLMDDALAFVGDALRDGVRVLVHCNQGRSRAPTIGVLAMLVHTDRLEPASLETSFDTFRQLYPAFDPAGGMRGFTQAHWVRYVGMRTRRATE